MNKLIIGGLLLLSSTAASAHPYNMGYYNNYHGGYNWVTPMIVGGVIGYELNRPQVIYQQAPQVIYQKQVYVYPQGANIPVGMKCEVREEIINGIQAVNNYCTY